MNYFSEKDVQDIVSQVVARSGLGGGKTAVRPEGQEIPVDEASVSRPGRS